MLKICLVFCESEPQYAYKLYAYKKKHVINEIKQNFEINLNQATPINFDNNVNSI